MKNKGLIFFWSAMAIAAVVLYIFQVETSSYSAVSSPAAVEQAAAPSEHEMVIAYYQQQCARCHGGGGEGVDKYPSLRNNQLTVQEIRDIILKGKGEMPAFPDLKDPLLSHLADLISKL